MTMCLLNLLFVCVLVDPLFASCISIRNAYEDVSSMTFIQHMISFGTRTVWCENMVIKACLACPFPHGCGPSTWHTIND